MPVTEMITMTAMGLFLLLGFIYLLRLIQAWLLHRSLREAIRKDSVHAGMLVDRIGRGDLGGLRVEAGTDDRTGLVLVAIGIAVAGFSLIANQQDWLRLGLGAALFPTLVGAALLLRHYLVRRAAEPDIAAGA
ncbi:MAG: hypothetical protein QOJ27_1591 [Sphingomonadales bacterium]|jgi:hypothetical protein|nr:hypothetical protein [Sphingomonadales bacterium]